jgi:myo-inositol catabolism protein IolH
MDDPRASRSSFVKSVGELLPELHDDGVEIFFEAHPGDFVEDSFDAVDLLRSFRSRHVGYNYCVPHTFNLGHGPRDIVRNAKGLLGYAHFADTLMPSRVFFSPTHPPKVKPHLHMIPGQGDVDMEEVISSLADAGFDGYLAAQPFSNSDEPVRAAKRTKAAMVRLIAGLKDGARAGR